MSLPPHASTPPSTNDFDAARQHFVDGLEQLAGGKLEAAESAFLASLSKLPGRVSTLVNLAAVRVRLGRPAEAIEAAEQVLRQEPKNSDAWFQRAEALAQLARREEALESFRQAAENNRAAVPWYRHGQLLQDLGRDADALASYQRAVAIDPGFAPAWTNQGNILREHSHLDEAATAFRQAMAHGATDALHDYYLASVSKDGTQAAASAPGAYVEGLFDSYAEGFDHHVVDVLGYQAPEELASGIQRLAPARWFRSVLDLGCGTGLCGASLKTFCERQVGVDLSGQMLARAKATGNYAQLFQQDIAGFLESTETHHDLVVAGDVFIYVGELAPVFAGVQRVLEAGGLFCFSVEALPQGAQADFELMPTLRFAHSQRYVRNLAAAQGFEVLEMRAAPIRQDQRQAIDGLYVFLRKAQA